MSTLRSDNIVARDGVGSVNLLKGAVVTGVTTSTSFAGSGVNLTNLPAAQLTGTISNDRLPATITKNLQGNVTGDLTGTASNASTLTGTPDITVRNITGVGATFSGNVSIGGTLTYEDVTNIDSVGLITARNGLNVTAGVSTFASTVDINGSLDATQYDGNFMLDVFLFT